MSDDYYDEYMDLAGNVCKPGGVIIKAAPPTPEDLARDLLADLSACDEATPLPWTAEYFGKENQHDVSRGPRDDARERFSILEDLNGHDAHMIARSREGWPAAIRLALHERARAEKAEALLRKMVEAWNSERVGPAFEEELYAIAQEAEVLLEGKG
jgi:hypothetical protein